MATSTIDRTPYAGNLSGRFCEVKTASAKPWRVALFSIKTMMVIWAVVAGAYSGFCDVTAQSYAARDALVAQWDGIENVGRGQHDATARFWADISGNGHTFTNFIDALSWNEDSLQMPSSAYMKAATVTGFTSPSCVSFEVVYKQTLAKSNNAILFAFDNFRGLRDTKTDNDNSAPECAESACVCVSSLS